MNLMQISEELSLVQLTNLALSKEPNGVYVCDLLSAVMAGLEEDNIWVTIQGHMNIVAVASLKEACAVIITEGIKPDSETLKKAESEEIVIFSTGESAYSVACSLCKLGL